jgi:tetratricopeptide (TPR) repeat protein
VFSSIAPWAMQTGGTQDLESIVTAAKEAQTKGEFPKAAEFYREAVKIRPDVAELWANLGLMDSLSGNSSAAIKDFTEAAHLNGSMYVPQLFLGIEYLKLNRAETALPYLQKAEHLNPRDPQVQLALGRAFALSGRGDRSSDA